LAEKWHLSDDIIQVIAHHHDVKQCEKANALVAIVHLSDLLSRVRGLGHGYYEGQTLDLVHDPAWTVLSREYHDLDGVDRVRFTFELDGSVADIHELVLTIFGALRSNDNFAWRAHFSRVPCARSGAFLLKANR
jgi:hypothetical protein